MLKPRMSEFVVAESSKERRLWKERGLLEVQIEKKGKMLHNTKELLKSKGGVQGWTELMEEANEMGRDIDELREEITRRRMEGEAGRMREFESKLKEAGEI